MPFISSLVTKQGYFHHIFPVNLIWLSSIFLFIGGGPFVFAAITIAFVSNAIENSSRYFTNFVLHLCNWLMICRTKHLFLLAAMPHIGKNFSPIAATFLMVRNIYLPSLASCIILLFCFTLLRCMKNPEPTHNYSHNGLSQSSESLLSDPPLDSADRPENSEENVTMELLQPSISRDMLSNMQQSLKRTIISIYHERLLYFFRLSFFLKSNVMASEAFAFQYLSERFD